MLVYVCGSYVKIVENWNPSPSWSINFSSFGNNNLDISNMFLYVESYELVVMLAFADLSIENVYRIWFVPVFILFFGGVQYKNVRPDYLKNIWKVINWNYASEVYEKEYPWVAGNDQGGRLRCLSLLIRVVI